VRGRAAGVLVVGWCVPVEELDPRRADLVGLAANEAASALHRLATVRHLEAAALTDPLTGIANRRCFDQELPRALARARRSGEPLSVAMLDLNRFKALNDEQGHEAGDRLLRAVAHAWLDALRGTDLLARVGGDEFAVLLPGCSAADHDAVAARLRAACAHEAGCGLGLALWDGREDRDALLRRADRAMYEDKTAATTVQSDRGSATVRPT
jgi:diguanylate cyclase (GGDEF)-like protein